MTSSAEVTVCVVPRERFSEAKPSLESILRHTARPFDLVYVDGRSPASIRRYLEGAARTHRFRLLREDRYLTPNQARNLGLSAVDSRYVAFVDNDLHVQPGWLERLVACAEETGAWLAGPLYHQGGAPGGEFIHMAGGEARIEERAGHRYLREHHHLSSAPTERGNDLKRERTELIEFHCVLARTDVLRRLGGLDEALLNAREHVDLCLSVGAAGGEIYLEPGAKVTFVQGSPRLYDLPYFLLRWSDEWTRRTLEHFGSKWRLAADDPSVAEHAAWCANYRRCATHRWRHVLRRGLGARAGGSVESWLERALAGWFARDARLGARLAR